MQIMLMNINEVVSKMSISSLQKEQNSWGRVK